MSSPLTKMQGLRLKRKSEYQEGGNLKVNIFPFPLLLASHSTEGQRHHSLQVAGSMGQFSVYTLDDYLTVFGTVDITSFLNCFPHLSFRTLVSSYLTSWFPQCPFLGHHLLHSLETVLSPAAQAFDLFSSYTHSLLYDSKLTDESIICISSPILFLNSWLV